MTSNKLPIKSTVDGAAATLELIRQRKEGKLTSLKTSFNKLNKHLLNGIDWYRIFTIGGMSGSGKSTILEQIKRDFLKLNSKDNFVILSFEFEMLIEDQLARSVAARTHIGLKDMYSADKPLSEFDMRSVEAALKDLSDPRSFYVDNTGTVEQIKSTIMDFVVSQNLQATSTGLVVTIDHLLLTKGKTGEAEKAIIDDLMTTLVELKKYYASIGQKVMFILLSQLNRDIESIDRVTNQMLHYPTKNDIFGASSVFNSSDYVMISHRPGVLVGMGSYYGPPKKEQGWPNGLPVKCPTDTSKHMVYWHLIKERFGKPALLTMVEDFEHASIKEYSLK